VEAASPALTGERSGYIFCTFAVENIHKQALVERKIKQIGFVICLLLVSLFSQAQTSARVYNEHVRTLRVERQVLLLENGIVDGTEPENTLHISFDEMSHDVKMYTYTVQMMDCSASLNDGLMKVNGEMTSSEYLQGFTTKDIVDYEHSMNTSREYTHYWFDFPNEDMQLTKSGAYELVIYEDGNPDNRVASVLFYVVEPLVKIDAKVRSNTDIEFNGRFQQLDIDINTTALDLRDPNEVKVIVSQNNRTDNLVRSLHPTFVEPNRLRYINNKELIFEAGNEYHHFDAFSCFYAGYGIDRIVYESGDYHALLFPNEIQQGQYIHEFDSDGRFVVNAERTSDSDTEAEYMWVHWTLPAEQPFFDGLLYVGGDIFNNELSLRNRMQYDHEAKCYWLTALVKQGGYDYQYWFVPKSAPPSSIRRQPAATTQRVDGSYWQTENEYTIYVFWRPFGARYDRLVGVSVQK